MNPIALRLSEMALTLEGSNVPEIVAALEIAEREINRLQELRDKGVEKVWTGRRFYFQTLKSEPNTPLAIIFNDILEALGHDPLSPESKAMYERFYPRDPDQTSEVSRD